MNRVDVRAIRRKQILEATKRLVAEKGWAEISIQDICREAKVSSGVITYHFRNKDEIMFSLLEDFLGQIKVLSYRAVDGAYSPQDDISTFIKILTSLLKAEPNFPTILIQLVAASLHKPEIAYRLHGLFNTARQQKIEEWKSAGVVSEQGDEGLILVSMIHSVALGVMLSGPFMGINLPRERLMLETERILLACLPSSDSLSQSKAS